VPARPAVVLTREGADNAPLARRLRAAGAVVREIPCASTRYRDPDEDEIRALPRARDVAALLFGSRRAVTGLTMWMQRSGEQTWARRALAGRPLLGAVGAATARALAGEGWKPDVVASPPTGESLAAAVSGRLHDGSVAVWPCGEIRAMGLTGGLEAAGISVRPLTVYANVRPEIPRLPPFPVASIFVAAPSAARRLLEAMPWMVDCRFVSIGPTTSEALASLGVGDVVEPGSVEDDWLEALVVASRVDDPEPGT